MLPGARGERSTFQHQPRGQTPSRRGGKPPSAAVAPPSPRVLPRRRPGCWGAGRASSGTRQKHFPKENAQPATPSPAPVVLFLGGRPRWENNKRSVTYKWRGDLRDPACLMPEGLGAPSPGSPRTRSEGAVHTHARASPGPSGRSRERRPREPQVFVSRAAAGGVRTPPGPEPSP